MQTKLLFTASLLALLTSACETSELVQPDPVASQEPSMSISSDLTSVDSYRNSLMIEERVEPNIGDEFNTQVYTSYGLSINDDLRRTGSRSARFEMRRGDGKIRSEILLPSETSRNRWYGMSLFLPSSTWQTDMDPDAWEIITQWHGVDDPGESARTPPLSLNISKGRLWFTVFYSSREINTKSTSTKKVFDLGPVIKDKWVDMVYHINFSHGSDGVLQIWRNGSKVVDYRGPNCYNDNNLPYLKAGLYKRNWNNISKRVIFIDDIRVGNGNASYQDVAPSGSGSVNPPVEEQPEEPVEEQPGDEEPDDAEPSPPSGSYDQKVVSYTLINADTDREIETISNGEIIDLSDLPTRNVNIRANTNSTVGSVYFVLSGTKAYTKTEGGAPYALFGSTGNNYHVWQPAVGSYTLKATPYSGSNRSGTVGGTLTINFSVRQ